LLKYDLLPPPLGWITLPGTKSSLAPNPKSLFLFIPAAPGNDHNYILIYPVFKKVPGKKQGTPFFQMIN